MPNWLKDAVFYEIYPQTFKDSNNDGIGDINGIIEKLDYVKDLGCNALWINPCYDSPFKDAGYDVRDYKKVAPRYGTNDDLYRLFDEAHKRDIHVLLDLVPGHTSEEHEWFTESKKAEKNEYSDRYIWTNFWIQGIAGHPYIGGEADRNGCYMLNFFKCQPALNYGFLNKTEDWQLSPDHPACIATREALKDIMRFWLDHGCDGFRVDMADSLVKEDDENKSATGKIWRNIREMLDTEYPEAAIVSEWSNPKQALKNGFHADFYLDHHGNGYNTLIRDNETAGGDHSFLKKDGNGDIMRFLIDYLPKYDATKNDGYISFITCNHDTPRARLTLGYDELKLAWALFLTLPGVPFIYYGDEIGMRYLDIPTKEGGYTRTGTRTPMQWDHSNNYGFSNAETESLYLPQDLSEDAPTVEDQAKDPSSLYNETKALIALRHKYDDLKADSSFSVIYAEKEQFPFVYRRGNLLIAINPSDKKSAAALTPEAFIKEGDNSGSQCKVALVHAIGECNIDGNSLTMKPQSFAMFELL
ncbi:alpha-amylase family glycosyl hydrolase [Butyrivibrio sp. YAB3001]|uniref:alpha-amylase family glycosyl hydrolase n=1 Tax=Butyrivibrio sp. YAB3001 TaxID=1520812 RepID=UPI0008F634DC|nr:alpha-amylase family glycosyl hydrolase [Butyrivibrio sp. YAB3001]SFB76202.1 maltose alpha-D-glucosyltransferase/ alpha-amylase [Butyrivibrio sp. YAB3001]